MEDLRCPLEEERDGDDPDSQETRLHRYLTDHGSSPGTCTPTHTSGDEDHTSLPRSKRLAYGFLTLEGGLSGTLGLSPRT